MILFVSIVSFISFCIWFYLIFFRGFFWLCNQKIKTTSDIKLPQNPKIAVIIPARNEQDVIGSSITSLLQQDYENAFPVILVDDDSQDQTVRKAQEAAVSIGQQKRLIVLHNKSLPVNWTGKLWALSQGIDYVQQHYEVDYMLLTDADIVHHSTNLKELVIKAAQNNLGLTSLMVKLPCLSWIEKITIPAFIFFFQKLYPFAHVNNSKKNIAAAAGGCVLIKQEALIKIGGLGSIASCLIDDCALAGKVKKHFKIWLGLSDRTCAIRPYDGLSGVWSMVARTAFTQLNYSYFLLLMTSLGMILTYMIPVFSLILGVVGHNKFLIILNILTLIMMLGSYLPTLKLYKINLLTTLTLPFAAFLYMLMTLDSARRHYQGKGGVWKNRIKGGVQSSSNIL
ncbi:MAG: glycosyltransferase [Alphaproteobacteria bacterium]|nr:glycosyltransferase [Alphaproteobacteria bacterium]